MTFPAPGRWRLFLRREAPMSKERPMLFSGEMVKSILGGQKTMTRRILKVDGGGIAPSFTRVKYKPDLNCKNAADRTNGWLEIRDCPYGKVGDRLWVRETFKYSLSMGRFDIQFKSDLNVLFGIDLHYDILKKFKQYKGEEEDFYKWRPSIHMPRLASRITLEITDIRIERLQDITEEDAINEGVQKFRDTFSHDWHGLKELQEDESFVNYLWHGRFNHGQGNRLSDSWEYQYSNYSSARDSFSSLWESINGVDSWKANPWVWVVEFKVIENEELPTCRSCAHCKAGMIKPSPFSDDEIPGHYCANPPGTKTMLVSGIDGCCTEHTPRKEASDV